MKIIYSIVKPTYETPDFETTKYACEAYYDKKPAVILRCKLMDTPYNYRVVFGFSTIVFKTLDEATKFCEKLR